MVTKAPAKKTPAKKAPAKRAPPKAVTPPKPIKTQTNMVAQAIDLIKWVDSPFKLITVLLLAAFFGLGAFAWDSRQVILAAITTSSHKSSLKPIDELVPIAQRLQKDLDAASVVVHRASLVVNQRTTLFALNSKGRDNSLDGMNTTLFSKDPQRNASMIGMLNGEVMCDTLQPYGKATDWEQAQGVKYVCRGSVPPEMGQFDGYVSVGFKAEPDDVDAVKVRINLATTDMAK